MLIFTCDIYNLITFSYKITKYLRVFQELNALFSMFYSYLRQENLLVLNYSNQIPYQRPPLLNFRFKIKRTFGIFGDD